MTQYLAIAFLITGFLVGDAYGNSVGDLIRKSKEDLKKIEADRKKEYFSNNPINPEQKKLFKENKIIKFSHVKRCINISLW